MTMKTFFTVKFALAPFVVFWALLDFASPGAAIVAGLILSVAGSAWRWRRREIKSLEIGGLAIFIGLGFADLTVPQFAGPNAAFLSLTGLGLVCLATVALRKPWPPTIPARLLRRLRRVRFSRPSTWLFPLSGAGCFCYSH